MTNEDVKLHDPHEFDKRFVDYTSECETYEEAYLMAEADYKKAGLGNRKYSSYNSFRVARTKRIKRMRKVVD